MSKDNISEDNILRFPDPSFEELDFPVATTPVFDDTKISPLTPTNKPAIVVHDIPKKSKSAIRLQQHFQKQRRSEEATLRYSITNNPRFQFTLTYKIKINVNQWRIVFWDPKRQEFTLENPSLFFHRKTVRLRSISAFY